MSEAVLSYFMVPILVGISILSVIGFLYNKRTGNTPGAVIGGAFTVGIIGVTLLSLYDMIVGL